jgi:hypothetical protein
MKAFKSICVGYSDSFYHYITKDGIEYSRVLAYEFKNQRPNVNLIEKKTTPSVMLSVGSILALVMSWSFNHSVLWALVHFLLSWVYVGYFLLFNR